MVHTINSGFYKGYYFGITGVKRGYTPGNRSISGFPQYNPVYLQYPSVSQLCTRVTTVHTTVVPSVTRATSGFL